MVEREIGRGMIGGGMWFVKGVAAEGPMLLEPFPTLERCKSHVLQMANTTAFSHPIYLHGHSFCVIICDGKPTESREWQDTVLISPRERVEIALVAENPGDWMFHCHILENQAAGMMGVIGVT